MTHRSKSLVSHADHGEEVDVFVREDEVYVCGRNLMQEPPEDPAAALPDAKAVAFLKVETTFSFHTCNTTVIG